MQIKLSMVPKRFLVGEALGGFRRDEFCLRGDTAHRIVGGNQKFNLIGADATLIPSNNGR